MEPVLKVEGVTKVFKTAGKPDFKAVDKVDFVLYPGETLGIVGESGSGKSTLAKLITRLADVTAGSLSLCGEDITHAKGKKLRNAYQNIQMVFQNPVTSFDPRQTLGKGIGESLKNRGVSGSERKQQVLGLLKQCGLSEEFYNRYPHEFSGGQCQRAALARALAIEPRIVICDEATSALDVTVQQQILELLQEFKEKKKLSYLFICHNLALVQMFCDRVLVMKDGKIVEQGTPKEIIFNPQNAYTKMLVESVF